MNIARPSAIAACGVLMSACQWVLGITDTQVHDGGGTRTIDNSDASSGFICGDGTVKLSEQCDDGNQVAGDGCSPSCHWEPEVVTAGGQQSCALAGNGVAKCWGDNRYGELGVHDTQPRGIKPNQLGDALEPVWLGTNDCCNARLIVTGRRHTCAALRTGEAIRCWGGEESDFLAQRQGLLTFTQPAQSMSAGGFHTCALFSSGSLVCWGANAYGQLGLGDTLDRYPFDDDSTVGPLATVDVGQGRKVAAFATGGYHTCALLEDRTLKCWGSNGSGQLGLGDTADRGIAPGEVNGAGTDVSLIPAPQVIVAGENHTCAIVGESRAVKCWGDNTYGQLGLGDTEHRGDSAGEMGDALAPVELGGAAVRSLALGASHSCALLYDGSVLCWGANDQGQLGTGTTNPRWAPSAVQDLHEQSVNLGTGRHAKQIAAGTQHTCALLDDGTVKCWGMNESGQLGQGDSVSRGTAPHQMGDELAPVDLKF